MSDGQETSGVCLRCGRIVGSLCRCADNDAWKYLFAELPFPLRHRWGGDWREFREGVYAASARTRISP